MPGQGKKLAQAARLWASGKLVKPDEAHDDGPTELDAAFAAWGLRPDSTPATRAWRNFYLWPCNESTWWLWHRLQTQWRIGIHGREGLDYNGVTAYLRDVARIKPRELDSTFSCLQAMERAALDEWAKQRKS
ncbi:MAG: DUF1799 domain-containing protein [Rhodoferax sp.]|nr:DUF1799 domain-containing protein [Rhodoferax sp.]